jgi:dipeptidyl aminopeptidase/acylaminoacyl peptidase
LSVTDRAATLRGLIPEDLLKFSWLEEISVAPAGDQVAYTVRRCDVAANGYQTDAYLLDLRTRAARKLTAGVGQAAALAWSRDSAALALAWRDPEGARIDIFDADGAPRHRHVIPGATPQGIDWSPDGATLAFSRLTAVRGDSETAPRPGIPAPTIRVVRRLRYKQNGAGWVPECFCHLWTLDLSTGDQAQLTDGECDYSQPRWSWNGRRLVFTATAREQNTSLGQGTILVYDRASETITPLMPFWEGAAISPQWRADDQAVAFAGYTAPPPVNRRLFYHVWYYDLESGQARDLTADLDQTVGNYAVADQRAGLTNVTVRWPGGDGDIYFLLTDAGATYLYAVSPNSAPNRLVGGEGVVFEYAPTHAGRVLYGQANPCSIGELYLRDGSQTVQLTHLNPWLGSYDLAEPQEYWYPGMDGARVHAWEMRPPRFDPARRYPAIVYVHCSMFSWDFNLEFQCLANSGYVVVYFNQRGTTAGYGQAHALGNYYGKHLAEYEEIMLGVNDLIARSYIDPTRLGVTGGSCGGFMTNWIVGHTNRFRAAVTQRSVTDLVSKFGTSDNGPEQAESEGARPPWIDVQNLWISSPIAYAPQIQTPLLILHAEDDHRCALSQAEELFAALRWLGREVELVIFQGEDHDLSRGGHPGNRIEHTRRILGWFDRFLRPTATNDGGTLS